MALVVLSRFAYVPFIFDSTDVKGSFLKFKWLSSALYHVGVEVGLLCAGFLLYHASRQMDESIGKYYRYASHVIAWVALYFLSWIFIDDEYFSQLVEIALSVPIATAGLWLAIRLQKEMGKHTEKLKAVIRSLFHTIVKEIPSKFNSIDVKKYHEEIVHPTIDKSLNEYDK